MGNRCGYGNIMEVVTTGASPETAHKNHLTYSGVEASGTMAQTDEDKLIPYTSVIKRVGRQYGIEPALIAAINSRDSSDGKTSQGAWCTEKELCDCTANLVDNINEIRNKFPGWTREQQLKGGIAAHNIGVQDVRSCDHMDEYTTGGDYSNDVVARAQWYKKNIKFR